MASVSQWALSAYFANQGWGVAEQNAAASTLSFPPSLSQPVPSHPENVTLAAETPQQN